jgi:hypothetical protein
MRSMTTGRSSKRLVELALESGFLDMERVLQAQKLSAETGLRIASVLVRYRFVNSDRLARFLSSALHIDILDGRGMRPSPLVVSMIPEDACRKLRLLPVGIVKQQAGELLNVAMIDPTDDTTIRHIELRLAKKVRPLLVDDVALEHALDAVFPPGPGAFPVAPAAPMAPAVAPKNAVAPGQSGAPQPRMLSTDASAFDDHVIEMRSVIDDEILGEMAGEAPAAAPKNGKRVCFVSTDQVLRMILENGLTSLVGTLQPADDIDTAFGLAHKGAVDAIVLCEPPADPATRSLVAQLSAMAKARIVVVSTLKAWRNPEDGGKHKVVDPPENLLQLPDAILSAIEA